ncbi:MAG: ROK family protein [Pacificimonas sp.]
MSDSRQEIVVGDIGGTHARFAVTSLHDRLALDASEMVTLRTAEYESLTDAWRAFQVIRGGQLPKHASLAVAAPLDGDRVEFTNNCWSFDRQQLADSLDLDDLTLLNDFAAVAHAVDVATGEDLLHLAGPTEPLPTNGVISVIGPGTGLGVAMLIRDFAKSTVRATEGGHIGFAPRTTVDERIRARLKDDYSRVSVERVVSGAGLRAIWEAIGDSGEALPPTDIELWTEALDGRSDVAVDAVSEFLRILGDVSGDIVLAHGADAVVVAGGLGLRLRDHFAASAFASQFVSKGRFTDHMRSIPVYLLTQAEPGLVGAAHAFATNAG